MRLRHIDSADAFILAYSVESHESMMSTLQILSEIAKRRTVHQIARVLVGCKSDSHYREVSLEEGSDLSAQLQCSFAETSALSDFNVYELYYTFLFY
ncbi:hypothetical protein WR25_25641 [Diploscapter pachys]|uniref:small monomeric GTPase n=1 Tax=Diploscapter pachys TaxID=2018661 RepID=A0A2A2KL88_9BILA|nr:hypothetical protein WR25_25641 [Diploscapter pachys]